MINAVGLYVCDDNPKVEILIDTNPEGELKRFTNNQFLRQRATLIDYETGQEADVLHLKKGYYLLRLKEPLYSTGSFDIYVRYTVDEKSDILLPTGNNLGTEESFVPSVSHWAHITANNHVHEWKSIDANWCVNAFMTDSDFDTVKAKVKDDKVTLEAIRYNKNATCKVAAAFFKGDEVVRKAYTPTFDEYGCWKISEDMDGVTKVKAILWQ